MMNWLMNVKTNSIFGRLEHFWEEGEYSKIDDINMLQLLQGYTFCKRYISSLSLPN